MKRFISLIVLALSLQTYSLSAFGLAIRSLVAMPLEQGGMVFRVMDVQDLDHHMNTAMGFFVYGLTGNQTLFFDMPYRMSPAGSNRSGDISALYRYTIFQNDLSTGTGRVGLVAGGLIPTHEDSDGGARLGATASYVEGRHQFDSDAVWSKGFGHSPDALLYDLSYQFRLNSIDFPNLSSVTFWNLVLEYNGRWTQGTTLAHQTTAGLQWVSEHLILEGAIVKTLNNSHNTEALVSIRYHV